MFSGLVSDCYFHPFIQVLRFLSLLVARVLISAVDCSDTDLKLVFFNNCMLADGDDKYRDGEL